MLMSVCCLGLTADQIFVILDPGSPLLFSLHAPLSNFDRIEHSSASEAVSMTCDHLAFSQLRMYISILGGGGGLGVSS